MSLVEYSLRWVRKGCVCAGYVDFMLFVSLLVALGTQRKLGSGRIWALGWWGAQVGT